MRLLILIFLLAISASVFARDRNQVRLFRSTHPCPATQSTKGACVGWIIDHRVGLCVGGPDRPYNLRWMTKESALAKDKWECKPGWEQKLSEEPQCMAKEIAPASSTN